MSFEIFFDWPVNLRVIRYNNQGSGVYEYENYDFWLIKSAYDYPSKTTTKEQMLTEIKGRFEGHPQKNAFLSSVMGKTQGGDKVIELLEANILNGDVSWKTHDDLASRYLEMGVFDKAANTYLRYPGFTIANPQKRVRTSNRAYEAGSKFYWQGEHELARPLYEISANLRTGSAASLTSAQRLAVLDEDFVLATQYAQRNALRYSNYYRYRDFLTYLHLFEANKDADLTFMDLASKSNDPNIWAAYLVGNRKQSKDLTSIVEELDTYLEPNKKSIKG